MNISPVQNPEALLPLRRPDTSAASETERNFSDFIRTGIDQVNRALVDGDRAIEKLHSGEAENLHDVMISVEQADISLRMLVQVRNRAVQAYEEILRMQV